MTKFPSSLEELKEQIQKDQDFEKTISDYLTFEFNMIMQGKE